MVDIATFVLDVVKCLAAPIGRPFMYLYNYKKNIDNLQEEVEKLTNTRDEVQRKVTAAEINEEEIRKNVQGWQTKVNNTINEAEELIQDKSNNPRCLKGLCPDLKTRYKHSKKAFKLKRDDIGSLLQQEERFDEVANTSIQSNYRKNFDKLPDDVLKLKNARDEVQRKIKKAENNVEEIKKEVKKWLEDVDSIIVKAEELIANQSSIGTDWETRYRNSKAASELMVDNIGPLLRQEERFDKVSHPTIHKEIWLRYNEDYLAFESRNFTVKNVWDALQDENIYMMGVYGMGGLGKTTLVQEIGRKAEKDKLFDEIDFVEVTETPDKKKIQTTIANKLGLEFKDAEDESQRASRLYSRMEDKKILLIVDNIWEELELKTVGIPFEADRGRNKILMTSRNLDVLEKMGSKNNFGMGILNEEESWNLFKKMTGDVIQTRELNSLPQDVCKECGGLPIVICTIAKALRNKSRLFDWKDALQELKKPSPTKFRGLLKEEYQKMALSYNYLRDDELKKTFLISSLFENNASISDLFKHVVGLDILEGANLTIEDARDRLDKLIRELKDSCLLLDGFTSEQFAMHDVVRAVAITIAYTDHHVFTKRNDVEREWKDKDKVKKCTKISLRRSSVVISQLWPNDLDCPDLEYFDMTDTWGFSFEIPENFFTVMPKLKVLILLEMHQSLLPSSLGLLTNLQTLCLDFSEIEDVTIIGKLKKLKVLSLENSNIKELPTEMGQLTLLRLLDLSNCERLKIIAPNVISKLLQLEEFHVKGCPIQWKVEVLEELKLLSELASLELDIKDNKMLPKNFFSKELKRYKILIGDQTSPYDEDDEDDVLRKFELRFNSTFSLEELRGIKNVEFLRLAEFSDVENSFNEFVTRTPLLNEKVIFTNLMTLELDNISYRKIWDSQFPTRMSSSYQNLTHFILRSCGKIKYVFPSSIAKSLLNLQCLEIRDCEVLEEIVAKEEGAKTPANFVFPQVTYLELKNLPELTAFHPAIHTCEMPMLKMLMIKECDKFTSKYLSFQENSFHILEPNSLWLDNKINSDLEELVLHNELRQVEGTRIVEGGYVKINHDLEIFELRNDDTCISWHGQSKVLEITDDKSANIPLGLLQRFKNLNELQVSFCHQYKELFFVNLQNLEVLNVECCSKLMKLLTPSTARSLVQLREMSIENCEMLIEIVANEGDATMSTEIVFDNLKKLSLTRLESLICFCSGNYSFNFPSLEELIIYGCPNMKTFSQGILSTPKLHKVKYGLKENDLESDGSELNTIIQKEYKEKVDSKLEKLTLSGRDIMRIWEGEFQERFGKVKTLQLIKDEYANIPIQILHKFNSLEKLILKLSSYEEIFSFGEDEEHTGPFTKLKDLKLQGLFNLKCIWKEDSRLNSILQNLDSLEVQYCDNLMTLLPSSTSFENLKTLTVSNCSGMQNLMSSSTVKSLVQLKELNIEGCEMMIEVIADEGDIEKCEIVFEKLKELELSDLESLTCFCSGNYTLQFPNLESLYVYNCSKMKTFSRGDLSMPKLQELNNKNCSESDIDTIIQQLQNDCSKLWERFPPWQKL